MPTFSTCFGAPFLPLDPSIYAQMLSEKVSKCGANVYLVNTGWNGTGKRTKLAYTRAMVTAALNGELEKGEFVTDPYFGVSVPTACTGVPSELLIPENTWEDKGGLCRHRQEAGRLFFVENFKSIPTCPPRWSPWPPRLTDPPLGQSLSKRTKPCQFKTGRVVFLGPAHCF